MAMENDYAQRANGLLICDTDLLETKVYSETYYAGTCNPILDKYAQKNQYHLYLLTYIDTPWVADDLRDKPTERDQMFKAFHQALLTYHKPFVIIKGNKQERLNLAIESINKLVKETP